MVNIYLFVKMKRNEHRHGRGSSNQACKIKANRNYALAKERS